MSADTILLAVTTLGSLLLAGGAMRLIVLERRAMLAYLEKRDRQNMEERHVLTNRIQAPQMVPVSPGARTRPASEPPKDAKALASIGTVRHGGDDGD